jgi:hypothetical protein
LDLSEGWHHDGSEVDLAVLVFFAVEDTIECEALAFLVAKGAIGKGAEAVVWFRWGGRATGWRG